MKIDLVVPYVNNQDKIWQDTFLKYALKHDYKKVASMHGERYEDIGLIYYNLKLINKFMPWISTIYLLLSNKEQVDHKLLPSNVKVVYHYEFIPYKYLPTFNSTTIEMFLWNIPNLSEHFIYINDDMLPLKPLKPSDFYYKNRIKMTFLSNNISYESTMFRHQCYNSYANVLKLTQKEPNNEYIYPIHSFTPMIKSHCIECFELIKDKILPQIRAFRNEYQHNQYIYPIYEHLFYGTYSSKINFFYTHLLENNIIEIMEKSDIVCLNLLKNAQNVTKVTQYLEDLCI